ncbi:MCE family protein [Gordonia sp. DT218]|uniref:MCE family protein n=1 Tax=unclassified Gordonia (in: high G+C Gram-positive bacteria) TaxID=2657482 RepID=UPI003CFA2EF5
MGIGKRVWQVIAAVVLAILVIVIGYVGFNKATNNTITAYFPSAGGLYNGDPVRVLGVNVGKVTAISPRDGDVEIKMQVDKDTPIPADAKAVVVAQSLVSGRFVQLTPVYAGGPKMAENADIPMNRTAVPVEWDDIKKQLSKLTEAVGPKGADPGSASKLIDVADKNLDGNGAAINASIKELSDVMGTLSAGRGDLFSTIRSLQKLTDALSTSHEQMVQFNGRIASVSKVLGNNTDELNGALHNLDSAMSDVQDFIDKNGKTLSGSVKNLADTTKILADKDQQIRGLLHSGPHQLANFYNIYNPMTGSLSGIFGLGMGANLITLLCGSMQANDRPGQSEAEVEKCVDVMAPVLSSISMNYPPFLTNPVTGINARPNQIQYQNSDVKARAQAGIREQDAQTRKNDNTGDNALGNLLVPFGGEK